MRWRQAGSLSDLPSPARQPTPRLELYPHLTSDDGDGARRSPLGHGPRHGVRPRRKLGHLVLSERAVPEERPALRDLGDERLDGQGADVDAEVACVVWGFGTGWFRV